MPHIKAFELINEHLFGQFIATNELQDFLKQYFIHSEDENQVKNSHEVVSHDE